MNIEDQIQTLLASAEPLRPLDDDDPRKERLSVIVDEVNRLRALQAKENERLGMEAIQRKLNGEPDPPVEEPKRGPGRPRKDAS